MTTTATDAVTGREHGGVFSGRSQARARPVEPARERLAFTDWLFASPTAGFLWLVPRVWLGYEWANAGYQKIVGSERSGFWAGGSAVRAAALSGVSQSHGSHPLVAYGWWAGFLHNVVEPNAGWMAKVLAVGELSLGIVLILGLFTGVVALCAVLLNVAFLLSGIVGVNPLDAVVATGLVLAWRSAGSVGLDCMVLRAVGTPYHLGRWTSRVLMGPELSSRLNDRNGSTRNGSH
ncbi:MAG TPA: DoxX family membrane protein [Acidimicrobiales bacterium]|nr:DoxX family membrane protein [Acidimicrobiales bacterium]